MNIVDSAPILKAAQPKPLGFFRKRIWRDRHYYLLIFPGLLFFLIFRYIPMLGLIIAFKDYNPFQGIMKSEWVGFQHFQTIFSDPEVAHVLMNTLVLSFLQILFAFPAPLIIALLLNEVRNQVFKRSIQSVVYVPHFLSWVVVISMVILMLKNEGMINHYLQQWFGIEPIPFLTNTSYFYPLVIGEVIWKEVGWGTILFLAALSGVNLELYEAAIVDGANRWKQLWHVTMPAIRGTVIIMLILRIGSVLDSGFEQIFLMLNPFNMEVGSVLDTFVYFKGIKQSDFSFATAVGLFKGLVGLVLVMGANRTAKKFGEDGLY